MLLLESLFYTLTEQVLDLSSEVPSLLGESLGLKNTNRANDSASSLTSAHVGTGGVQLWLAQRGSRVAGGGVSVM